jgi:galactokinase
VELLGNHTDYNGGLVLAAAIDRYTDVGGQPLPRRLVRVHSVDFQADDTFNLDAIGPSAVGHWSGYVRGVAWALQERYGPLLSGFEARVNGGVPIGTGLSSSASLQAALALFLVGAGLVAGQDAELDDPARMELAHALRRAENDFVGVSAGILDQFTVLLARRDCALFLDCETLAYERLPLGRPAPAIVVCDSKTSRRLADGKYNERFAECRRVVAYFRDLKGWEQVNSLRQVTLEEVESHWGSLDAVGRLRARHVLTENERVREGAEALRAGDVAALGRLMSASHVSSRDDFGNSSAALDALIEAAQDAPGFLGGKLSGAGWAGCTANLVAAEQAGAFAAAVEQGYAERTGNVPEIHICRAAEGASAAAI